jgi:16S rRNA (adenine1518-N6/adenine1519-N6)-dimethyltransferase
MFAKKSLGQNFLNSPGAITKMIAGGAVTKDDTVLEVGPGKGVLTRALLDTGATVIAVEKDDRLIATLQETFAKEIITKKFTLIHGDGLEINPKDVGLVEHQYKVIANIPYYITGAFFKKFFSEVIQPSTLVVLIQKEVAERIMVRDGKESILSLSVKIYGTPVYVGTVVRGSFFPIPNVDSAILAVTDISKKNFSKISEQLFFDLVKTGFAHKRKKLLGNLRDLFSEEKLNTVFEKINLSKDIRAEDLQLSDWITLAISFDTTMRQEQHLSQLQK